MGAGALAACGSVPPQSETTGQRDGAQTRGPWQGRFALSYRDDTGQLQSTTAIFELRGMPQEGTLWLGTPLGTQMAEIRWSAANAVLQQAQETRIFPSLDKLLLEALGSPFPVRALFQWLEGRSTPDLTDWEADLSALPQGKLTASKAGPAQISLRILLTR